VLTLATAIIHIFLALSAIPYYGLNFGVSLFILNGLGYLGLLAVLGLPIPRSVRFQSATRWVLVAYAALTVVIWVIMAPVYDFIGYTDKAIEIVLIALLLAEARKTASEPSGVASGTRTTRPLR
jgi:hypothetical protein